MTQTSKLLPSQASGSVFPAASSGSEVSASRCATPCVADDSGKRKAASFTPGPWSVHRKELRLGWMHVTDNDELIVANIKKTGTAASVANARLIAAAPDMLAELLTARCPRPANNRPDFFTAQECAVECRECGCSIGAAISKATGLDAGHSTGAA